MNEYPFVKMHGLGNCFVLMDNRNDAVGMIALSTLAKSVCDRNYGIGADGLILVNRSSTADLCMRIFNEDGSEAEMCGNGIRCFQRYVVDEEFTDKRHLKIETMAGIIHTRLIEDNRVEVDMGEPILNNDDISVEGTPPIAMDAHGHRFTFVSMGNPHAIAFVDNYDFDWRSIGQKVEKADAFPNKTNVEFIKIEGPNAAEMKVWERGCGETLACGTGACASVVAGALNGLLPREPITVTLPGGPLLVHWNDNNRIMMTGPAVNICKGVYWL